MSNSPVSGAALGGSSGAPGGPGFVGGPGGGPGGGTSGRADGGGEPGFVNLGITSYRPQPEGPDDPGYANLEELAGYYETERYGGFEARLRLEAEAAGLRVVEVRRVVGVWEGEFEPAVSVDLEGDPAAARGIALRLKAEYTQEGVMEFGPDPDGPDRLYRLEGVSDREGAARLMRERGFPGGRFEGEVLEIADKGAVQLG